MLIKGLFRTRVGDFIRDFITEYRGIVIILFVLPLSFTFDQFFTIRNYFMAKYSARPELHEQRVKEVQNSVLKWNADGRKKPMCTDRLEWLTMSARTATFKEDCSRIKVNLHDVLEVDEDKRTVRVEPLVDMGQLSRHLLRLGWTLAVMIEMEDLTVGGLLMGTGISNSSHIHGLLSETVVRYEVVLGDGTVAFASRTENPDLYEALPWSHGTLGFLVSAELKIIPAKPYVHIHYIPCHSQSEMVDKIEEFCNGPNPPSFVEMTIYSKETSVIMIGEFADKPEDSSRINPLNRWYKPWFYKYVQEFLESGSKDEFVPLRHWFHRHTRSIFWYMEELLPCGNQWWYRYLLGWLGAPKISFLKWSVTPQLRADMVNNNVAQDLLIPLTELGTSIDLFDELFHMYPLLFYPARIYPHPKGQGGLLRDPACEPRKGSKTVCTRNDGSEIFFDLGAYGVPPIVKAGGKFDAQTIIRRMEDYARSVKGYQFMYADTFMSQDEFEQVSRFFSRFRWFSFCSLPNRSSCPFVSNRNSVRSGCVIFASTAVSFVSSFPFLSRCLF
ncbi:hypothetical protein C8J56DRAFT_788164 [Mycena floridula]|nr:hypothetical protein C8J56DRAFT_788164 [Mycena floridula]